MTCKIRCMAMVLMLISSVSDIRSAGADGTPAVPGPRSSAVGSFDECVQQGGKILKSYPPRCISKDGSEFLQEIDATKRGCKDLCGDGICQEMVCMAVGCPCAESVTTCSTDCR
jgi:hypothetical protein